VDVTFPPDYAGRVYAGVPGKIIGVYLGRPFDGWTHEQILSQLISAGSVIYDYDDRGNLYQMSDGSQTAWRESPYQMQQLLPTVMTPPFKSLLGGGLCEATPPSFLHIRKELIDLADAWNDN
jgi:hypothetical protein